MDFVQQVQKIVTDLGQLIAQTVEEKLEEFSKFDEKAASTVSSTFDELREKANELSNANAKFKSLIEEKEAEILKIQSNMKNNLVECYEKNSKSVKKLEKERNDIHEEAAKLKTEAQKMIGDCLTNENREKCFQKGFSQIEKKAQKLLKNFQDLVKKETNARVECTKRILECDKKAVDTAEKKVSKIIDEITKASR
ncbi:uncharacterized protein LOC117182049 [Belonocnema kinseyi]|uniref:uncharacterized protein LOC117182049 n=1 Tax=Belonocnema kinseyi TaxID=2817044 RepID=UPI00143DBE1B|nr:uncharacterized protein LOC117182049 [Belonocnema kinseyi]